MPRRRRTRLWPRISGSMIICSQFGVGLAQKQLGDDPIADKQTADDYDDFRGGHAISPSDRILRRSVRASVRPEPVSSPSISSSRRAIISSRVECQSSDPCSLQAALTRSSLTGIPMEIFRIRLRANGEQASDSKLSPASLLRESSNLPLLIHSQTRASSMLR